MVGSIIATSIFGAAAAGTFAYAATAFAINLVASTIISKAFAPNIDNTSLNANNPGSNPQHPTTSCRLCTARAGWAAL